MVSSTDEIAELHALEPAELAWAADHLTLSQLEPDQRQWFENVHEHVTTAIEEAGFSSVLHADCLDALDHGDGRCVSVDDVKNLEANTEWLETRLGLDGEWELADAERALAAMLAEQREEGIKDATIPSRASAAQTKAMRLLVEQRLTVDRIDITGELRGLVVATCKGDSGQTYRLGYNPRIQRWRCTCQELKGQCSHLLALKLVVRA